MSQTISESGGAGYIYFDGKYHVLASFYSNLDDAESVAENLINEYPNTQVLTIECKHFYSLKNLTDDQNSAIKNLIDSTKKIILQLEDLSIKFDTKEMNFNEANVHIKKYSDEFASILDGLFKNFKTNSKFNTAKEYAQEIQKTLTNLSNSDEQNFSTTLRYSIVDIAITLTQFSSSL
ncbi:MAG: hypothetical protein IJ415_01180 [Clostridia bacterium]|nr:hypothetical protein [Clostridia bacterium]